MSDRFSSGTLVAIVLASFAAALGLWNAWTLAGVQGQLRVLEARAPAPAPIAAAPEARPAEARPARPEPPVARPIAKLDLDDPEVQDRILDRLEEHATRREQDLADLRSSMQEVAEAFADEEGLDGATRQRLFAELRRRVDGFEKIRGQVRSGQLPLADARERIEALRADSDELLGALLGPDDLARLERALQNERLSAFDPP